MSRPNPPIRYVCGFLFDPDLERVALIIKNRGPANMAGKLNGIGGKINPGESARGAMAREFLEETGVHIDASEWLSFHTETYFMDSGSTCYFMTAASEQVDKVRTMESERVVVLATERHNYNDPRIIPGYMQYRAAPPMYNLAYLIPMARVWLASPLDRFFEG